MRLLRAGRAACCATTASAAAAPPRCTSCAAAALRAPRAVRRPAVARELAPQLALQSRRRVRAQAVPRQGRRVHAAGAGAVHVPAARCLLQHAANAHPQRHFAARHSRLLQRCAQDERAAHAANRHRAVRSRVERQAAHLAHSAAPLRQVVHASSPAQQRVIAPPAHPVRLFFAFPNCCA
ncbi:hypothetical protein FGB62_17g012 [Gracilaria domingensis]|nr:hypothetical protein FGB62_17g012 [Gracilaria domingensis]